MSVILVAGLISFCRYQSPCIKNADITHQNGWQDVFDVKAERKLESCSFVPGAYYVFSARQANSAEWREVMTFRHDDPKENFGESIQIVNSKVAFIFMGWKSAITFDSGKTWNLWNAEEDIENWKGVNYRLIEKMSVSENGEGVMILNPLPDRNEPKELYTSDFGKTWKQTK